MRFPIALTATALLAAGSIAGLAAPAGAVPATTAPPPTAAGKTCPNPLQLLGSGQTAQIKNCTGMGLLGQFTVAGQRYTRCFDARRTYKVPGATSATVVPGPCLTTGNNWSWPPRPS